MKVQAGAEQVRKFLKEGLWSEVPTSRWVVAWTSDLSLSTSVPLRPLMIPGREVWMLILSLFAARSISTRETPACEKRFFN